ncbi:hypothetical protein ACP4OV_004864 [Aristida adscensionis]
MQAPPPPPPVATAAESAHRRASSTCSTKPTRSIGCMAGLLRLISPYHRSHHRKRLTAKNAASPPPPSSPPKKKKATVPPSPSPSPVKPMAPPSPSPVKPTQQPPPPTVVTRRRRSCDAPRSPTIAPEHRRASCDSPRPPPPAIVARLMGLEESAPPSPAAAVARPLPTRPPPPPPAPETAAEKRRKLLGALEKCDEDLKTLRRIIAAVRAAEMRAAAASDAPMPGTPPAGKAFAKWKDGRDEQPPSPSPSPAPAPPQQQHKPRAEEQFPSPDSVLDAITSPRFPCRKRPSPCTNHDAGSCGNGAVVPAVGSKIVKPSRTFVFSAGDYCRIKPPGDELRSHLHCHSAPAPVVAVDVEAAGARARLPRAAGAESWRHHRRRWELEAAAAGRVISRAMVESVEDVWGHGHSGEQRREAGMVATALERAVLEDLVAGVVAELLVQPGHGHGAGCRKRLCFG